MNKNTLLVKLTLELSKTLSRPLVYKKSTDSRADYFIFDPVIKYLASTRKDYRSGFRIEFVDDDIWVGFCTMYNKNIFKNILTNFDESSFKKEIYKITHEQDYYLGYSSYKHCKNIDSHSLILDENIYSDLGFEFHEDDIKGTYFNLQIKISNKSSIRKIINTLLLFKLFFISQFPTSFSIKHEGNFRRSLLKRYKDQKIKIECAYKKCNVKDNLDACHIVPHSIQKDNRPQNGIFMCRKHHMNNQEGQSKEVQRKILKISHIKNTILASKRKKER